MTALIGLVIGMTVGIVCRELWARRAQARGVVRTVLMALALLLVWAPILWLIVTIFLKPPPG